MSAIAGLLHFHDQPVAAADLERMSEALAAHGPDRAGLWTHGSIGLAQRLMCVTPEDRFEQQPVLSADRQLALVSGACLDNRPELTRELDILPPVDEQPDSAFILRAYEKWGQDCLHHLVGAYSFALWDAREQRLLLVRSPFGGSIVFYHHTPEVFAFATMPKGLLALPFVPRALNEERLADYLARTGSEPHATFYRGISCLLPGHVLTSGREGLMVRRYWQLDLNRRIHFPRDEDYVEAFSELFDRVVSDHLRSLTPVGVFMSGGLDSTSVAATAARLLKRRGERLATFTEVPRAGFTGPVLDGRYADETPFVQAVARLHANLDVNLIRTDWSTFLDGLERFFAYAEEPFPNTANRVWWEAILQAAQQQGVRVLLTGEQGNLSISWGGDGLLPELLRTGQWGRALHEARAQRGEVRAIVSQGIVPLLPAPLWLMVQRLRGKVKRTTPPWQAYSAIHPDFAAAHKVELRARDRGQDFHARPPADTRQIRYEVIAGIDLAGSLTTGYQAMFGVETRCPLVDARLVEFCLALPEDQYLRDGRPRWLLRRAMADRLPPAVLGNRKRGLQAADWFERLSAIRPQIFEELAQLEQSDLARRVLDLPRLRRLVEQWPQGGWGEMRVLTSYRTLLESGLMVGRFIRWFEAGG
ncbi:MAG TPA: asparagine synthase-related protein [Candidatus Binatia bacterium]|nr:asparagine synthase-related protein [Candidatus Binatia bacterium]